MAVSLTLTIQNNAIAAEIVEAVCVIYDYHETINGAPNPMTRQEFVKEQLRKVLRSAWREHKIAQARKAEATIAQDTDNISIT